MKFAIIGGTGVYAMDASLKEVAIATPYGEIVFDTVTKNGKEIVFLPRHGKNHSTPPHKINYLGNMWALKEYGVEKIYATGAVGSCNPKFSPGDVVVLNDFLDFTKVRPITFFDGKDGVAHVSMKDPYCKDLRELLFKYDGDVEMKGQGIYVCTEGPRFETAAEISYYKMIGGDVVGMTNVPEVVLAKELGMCYSCVGIITNWCTGLVEDEASGEEILGKVAMRRDQLTKLFIDIFLKEDFLRVGCECRDALIRL